MSSPHAAPRRGFTLIELLVVIAIIAILAVVVVLTLNPAQLLAESRDANRVSDMATLQSGINLYSTDQSGASTFFLGTPSTTYLSVPSVSSSCATLGLATSAFSYACSTSANYRIASSSGWLPINFNLISSGAPFGSVPVDPTNSTSSNLYYAYNTNGVTYEVNTFMESTKYAKEPENDGGNDPVLLEAGSGAATLADAGRGLIGYWPLDEGSGNTAVDWSGEGNSEAWTGSASGTSGHYSPGHVEQWAGYFDGSTNYITTPAYSVFNEGAFTVTAWVYPTVSKEDEGIFGVCQSQTPDHCLHLAIRNGVPYMGFFSDDISGGTTALNTWYFLAFTYTGGAGGIRTIYLNGTQVASGASASGLQVASGTTSMIGEDMEADMQGMIQEVRLYDRTLSASEILEMYNEGK